jgi:23S rRNA pseudouridine1911/1915/1917 synthase
MTRMQNQHFRLSCWSLLYVLIGINGGSAFSAIDGVTRHPWRSSKLFARRIPTSYFDLEAVEAFETQMDLDESISEKGTETDDGDEAMVDELFEDQDTSDGIQEFVVPPELHNKRIDAVIASLIPALSRSACGTLVADGQVQDGDEKVLNRKSHKVAAGTTLRVAIPRDEKPLEIVPENLPLDIIYEDGHMIVLNKAAGMVVHPAAGNWDGTVVNALAYYLSTSPHGSGDFMGKDADSSLPVSKDDPTGAEAETNSFRPGIVHRLDKGTTGVLVVAKTSQALATLSAAFAARTTKKTYVAITVGNPGKKVVIDKPIGRHPINRQRMRVVPDPHRKDSSGTAPKDRMSTTMLAKGRRALSFVDTLAFDSKLALVQVGIETGRTHQIRVHLQDRHTPIYGDDVYGIADWNKRLLKAHGIQRPLLHAYRLEVDHPVTGERMTFVAPMADDMKKLSKNIWPTGPEESPEIFQ